jgi:hypothetical protein
LAIDSRMSLSVTTLQWHTYIPAALQERERGYLPEVDPGRWVQVSLT